MNAASPQGGPQLGGPSALPSAIDLAKETLAVLVGDGRAFLGAAMVPAAGLLVAEWLWIRFDLAGAFGMLYGVAGIVFLTAFAVACHRRVLLGIGSPTAFSVGIGAREGRYVIFMLLLVLSLIGSALALSLLATLVLGPAEDTVGDGTTGLMVVLTIVVVLFFLARLSLVLPAAAVDHEDGFGAAFRWSWRRTGPAVWRLICAYVLVAGPVYAINWGAFIFLGEGVEDLTMRGIFTVFDTIMQFLAMAIITVYLSVVYRRLGGMAPSVVDIEV